MINRQLIKTSRVPVVCDLNEISDNDFNHYHYQPGTNNIIVYGKHIMHARMYARTHTHTLARTPTHPPPSPTRLSLFDGSVCAQPWWRYALFSPVPLGRTETRTCDRMCFQTIQTVWDISRDDRARIATCSLLTVTDRQTDLRRIIV